MLYQGQTAQRCEMRRIIKKTCANVSAKLDKEWWQELSSKAKKVKMICVFDMTKKDVPLGLRSTALKMGET